MPAKRKSKITPLMFDTYLTVIKNSIGSKLFRNFYAKVDGKKADIMRNGELSCAFYVSSVLSLFRFIKKAHGTVDATVKDLKESGWKEIRKPKVGSILVWEKINFGDHGVHRHIGFFIGQNKAVSNSDTLRCPVRHSWNFNGKRKIDMIFWNPKIHSKKQ